MTTREFGTVVERDRSAMRFVQLPQTLFEFLMHVVRVLGLDLDDNRESRLAVDQRRQAARARRAEHRVAFEVAQTKPLLDDLGAIVDPRRIAGGRRFSPAGTLAATPQVRLPVRTVLASLDPCVDRLRRNDLLRTVGIPLLHPTGDLRRRPIVCQTVANDFVDFLFVHLTHDRTFLPPALGLTLGLCGVILIACAIAFQLATDGRRRTPDGLGNLRLFGSLIVQLRYTITLFGGKLICHRWDSVPQGKV